MSGPLIKREPNIKSEGGDSKNWKNLPVYQPTFKSHPAAKHEDMSKALVKSVPPASVRSKALVKTGAQANVFPMSKAKAVGSWGHKPRSKSRHHPYSNGPFRGTCYDCGQVGHRRGDCQFKTMVFEVNKKYKIKDPKVVGSLNRLEPYFRIRREKDGAVHYVVNNTDFKIDDDAIVEVREANQGRKRLTVPGTDITFLHYDGTLNTSCVPLPTKKETPTVKVSMTVSSMTMAVKAPDGEDFKAPPSTMPFPGTSVTKPFTWPGNFDPMPEPTQPITSVGVNPFAPLSSVPMGHSATQSTPLSDLSASTSTSASFASHVFYPTGPFSSV